MKTTNIDETRRASAVSRCLLGLGLTLGIYAGAIAADPAIDAYAAGGRFLYVESNNLAEGQNSIIAYLRANDGTLSSHPKGPFMTGGTGLNNDTNGKLGPNDNDTPVIASSDNKRLFAVNGHSNTIAVFDIMPDGALSAVQGSPFPSEGVGPVSLAITGDVLLVANRNEDPHQLDALRGAAESSYVSFRIEKDGKLSFLSKIGLEDGQKSSQILVSSRDKRIAFGNDFQVDADFDGEGGVSKLFGERPQVRGRLQSFMLDASGTLVQAERMTLPETVSPAPDVPTVPLGMWDHPKRNLLYVGLVTRNELGVFRYDEKARLNFVAAVPNSGQDVCWLRVNAAGTRLFAVNNLPRSANGDQASTITVFDISGDKAESPVELSRTEIPMPLGTFINNRNMQQPNSTAFQFTLDESENYLYVINQRVNQTATNTSAEGNVLHAFQLDPAGSLTLVASRKLTGDGVNPNARPQGVVAVDL